MPSISVGFGHDKSMLFGKNANVDVDQAGSMKTNKRKTVQEVGSQDCPIIIEDSDCSSSPNQEPPKKRRRIQGIKQPLQKITSSANSFTHVQELVQSSRKVIVLSGAGISANAGFSTFKEMRKSEKTSFHRTLYASTSETELFHSTICGMFARLQSCEPAKIHKFMGTIACDGRLMRHYTQNIDCVEKKVPALETKTTRLHGQINQMRCQTCNWVGDFQPLLFQGEHLPTCQDCTRRNQDRISDGKRRRHIGILKPDVVLYGDPHPDETELLKTINKDLMARPDLVLVVGTSLRIPGALDIATNFSYATRSRGGLAVWISKEKPPSKARHLFDLILLGDCDALTSPLSH